MARYSQRLPSSLSENAITRLIREKKGQGIPLLDLTVSNPTRCFDRYPHEAIHQALASVRDFAYDPHPAGLLSARQTISAYYAERSLSINPDQIILTASTSEAYGFLFKLLCDSGDEILAPAPSYPLFEFLAALENIRIVPYPLHYDGSWYIDLEALRNHISPRTRAIVTVNPNNPTGGFLSDLERNELLRIADESDLALISDEVFMDFSFGQVSGPARSLSGNKVALTFSLNGLSKLAGMPQIKLGWIVISGPPAQIRWAHERLEVIVDTYLSVGTPVQKALPALIGIGREFQGEIVERLRTNLQNIARSLQKSPVHQLRADGGWSAILQLPRTKTEECWVASLLEQGVIAQPGYFFDMPSEAYMIVSLITLSNELVEGLHRLHSCVVTRS